MTINEAKRELRAMGFTPKEYVFEKMRVYEDGWRKGLALVEISVHVSGHGWIGRADESIERALGLLKDKILSIQANGKGTE